MAGPLQVLQSRVLLRPADFTRSVDFYEHRLGLVRYREWGDAPHRGVVYFLGGGYLELSETGGLGPRHPRAETPPGAPSSPPPPPAGVRLWLQVADAAAAARALEEAGVVVDEPPERKPWGLVELVVHDPDGLPLVVIETPLDHPLRRRD